MQNIILQVLFYSNQKKSGNHRMRVLFVSLCQRNSNELIKMIIDNIPQLPLKCSSSFVFPSVSIQRCQFISVHLDSSQFISLPRQPSALFRFSSPIFLRDLWKFVTTRNKSTIGSFRYPRVPLCSLHSKQNCYVFSLLFLPICPETRCMNF